MIDNGRLVGLLPAIGIGSCYHMWYQPFMPDVREYLRSDGSCPFRDRFTGLRDPRAKARIDSTVRKLGRGLKPDVRSVGEGVHEARIDHGPGYRVYFGNDGAALVVLLLCGDKRTQDEDIAAAKKLWADYQMRKNLPPLTQSQTKPVPPLRPEDDKEL